MFACVRALRGHLVVWAVKLAYQLKENTVPFYKFLWHLLHMFEVLSTSVVISIHAFEFNLLNFSQTAGLNPVVKMSRTLRVRGSWTHEETNFEVFLKLL